MDSRGIASLKLAAALLLAAGAAGGWALLGRRRHGEVASGPPLAPSETAGPIVLRFDPADIDRPHDLVRFAGAPAGSGECLFAEREPGGAIELGYGGSPSDPPVFSPALPRRAGTVELLVSLSSLYPARGFESWKSWLLVRLDGAPFWEVPVAGAAFPRSEPMVGDGVAIELPAGYPAGAGAAPPFGRSQVRGARLSLQVEPGMVGHAFPLVETGSPGRSDLVFFQVLAGPALIFGYCHDQAAPFLSPPIAARYGRPIEVAFLAPSLAGLQRPAALSIRVDSQLVWTRLVPSDRAAPGDVYFGGNPLSVPAVEAAITGARFEGVANPTWTGD